MNEKIENLIHVFEKTHRKISNKYKNLEVIEGQYNPRIKTIAKILWLQTENKIKVYNTMLLDASKMEMEITEEGYQQVLMMTKKCETDLHQNMAINDQNIIAIAIEFSKVKMALFKNVLDLLNQYETEREIKHEALKEKIITILQIEEKDCETLETFKYKNEL